MSAFWQTECVHGALAHVSNAGRHVSTILTTGYRGATEPDHRFLGKAGGTASMPKILTVRRREDERERARLYLKSRLMLPTIPLGMVTLLAGYGDIVLMWVQNQLTPQALLGARSCSCAAPSGDGGMPGTSGTCWEPVRNISRE